MLSNQKSQSLLVTIMTSLNQTLSWWSTSLTYDPLSTFPTSQPHLTLTNWSKSPHIDLTQWSVSSTLMTSTHWPVLSTNWVWWLVCCHLWLLWLVFSPKNSSVSKWSCCVSSLTFLSSTLMVLCNCLSLPWNLLSSQQDTTYNGLTCHTLRLIRIHLNLLHWTLMSWHYHTTSIWWVCCMCCLWFSWYRSYRWKPSVSGSCRWFRWVTSGWICCWVKSCCTLCCSICSTFCSAWSSSTKMEGMSKSTWVPWLCLLVVWWQCVLCLCWYWNRKFMATLGRHSSTTMSWDQKSLNRNQNTIKVNVKSWYKDSISLSMKVTSGRIIVISILSSHTIITSLCHFTLLSQLW